MKHIPLKYLAGVLSTAPLFSASMVSAQAPATQPADVPRIEEGSAKAGLRDFLAEARKGDAEKFEPLWSTKRADEKELVKPGAAAVIAVVKLQQKIIDKFGREGESGGAQFPTDSEIAAAKETVHGDIHAIAGDHLGERSTFNSQR